MNVRPRSADCRSRGALAETRQEDCGRVMVGVRPDWKTDIQSPRIPYYKHNATFSSLQTPGGPSGARPTPQALPPETLRPGFPKHNGSLVPIAGSAGGGTNPRVSAPTYMMARLKTASSNAKAMNSSLGPSPEPNLARWFVFRPGPARDLMICLGWLRLLHAIVRGDSEVHGGPRMRNNPVTRRGNVVLRETPHESSGDSGRAQGVSLAARRRPA